MKKKKHKITVGLILSWMFGSVFTLIGYGLVTSGSFFSGLIVMLGSLFLIPPIQNIVADKLNIKTSKGIKWVVAIVVIIICSIGVSNLDTNREESNLDKDHIENKRNLSNNSKALTKSFTQLYIPCDLLPPEDVFPTEYGISKQKRTNNTCTQSYTESGLLGDRIKVKVSIFDNASSVSEEFNKLVSEEKEQRKYTLQENSKDIFIISRERNFLTVITTIAKTKHVLIEVKILGSGWYGSKSINDEIIKAIKNKDIK